MTKLDGGSELLRDQPRPQYAPKQPWEAQSALMSKNQHLWQASTIKWSCKSSRQERMVEFDHERCRTSCQEVNNVIVVGHTTLSPQGGEIRLEQPPPKLHPIPSNRSLHF